MPFADVGGVKLFYEETGAGAPLVFVHEFAGDHQSWHLQVRFFSRRYRTIAYNARGLPALRRAGGAGRLLPGPRRRRHPRPPRPPEDPQGPRLRALDGRLRGAALRPAPSGARAVARRWRGPATAACRASASASARTSDGDRAPLRDRRHGRRGRLLHQGPHPGAVHGQGPAGLAGVLRPVHRPVRPGPRADHARGPDVAAVDLRPRSGDEPSGSPDPHHDRRRGRALPRARALHEAQDPLLRAWW